VDIELFAQSAKVEQALMRQSCTECLQWCKENNSSLKKIKVSWQLSFPCLKQRQVTLHLLNILLHSLSAAEHPGV